MSKKVGRAWVPKKCEQHNWHYYSQEGLWISQCSSCGTFDIDEIEEQVRGNMSNFKIYTFQGKYSVNEMAELIATIQRQTKGDYSVTFDRAEVRWIEEEPEEKHMSDHEDSFNDY